MELMPLTLASGVASRMNAYLAGLMLGLLGRFVHVVSGPSGLQRVDVLIVMASVAAATFMLPPQARREWHKIQQ